MMASVHKDENETVVVFALSRFARPVSHVLKGLEAMRKNKCVFISLTQKIDLNTSLGHLVFVLISAIEQLEPALIAERVRNGFAAAKARGQGISQVRTRNSALIESLLNAGLSFKNIAKVTVC